MVGMHELAERGPLWLQVWVETIPFFVEVLLELIRFDTE